MCGRVFLVAGLWLACFLLSQCSGPTGSDDDVRPGLIDNLMVTAMSDSSATLSWTAPGDDGVHGTASSYIILYSPDSVLVAGGSDCPVYTDPPIPKPAGTVQSSQVSGLSPDRTYWFGIISEDERGNRSEISNIVSRDRIYPINLRIAAPANHQAVADLIKIRVTVSGSLSPILVSFYGDDLILGSTSSDPWELDFNLREFPHGSNHQLYAIADGPEGENYYSDSITVTIDTTLSFPTAPLFLTTNEITDVSALVVWNSSRDDDFQRYWLSWSIRGEFPDSLNTVILYHSSDTTYRLSNLAGLTQYDITVTVEDLFGNRTSLASEIITLDSIPPVASIKRVNRTSSFAAQVEFDPISIHDFLRYEILRSNDSIISADDLIAAKLDDSRTGLGYDKQYDFSVDNFYYVRVVDTQGFVSSCDPVRLPASLTGNWAVELDGVDDLLVIPYVKEVLRPQEWTIEMWVYAKRLDPISAFFSQSLEKMEFLMSDKVLRYGMTGCLIYHIYFWFPQDEWVHVALTRSRENDTERLYINGVQIGNNSCGDGSVFTSDLFLGCRQGLTGHFKGMIDEVKIWNRPLTLDEIRATYRKEIVGTPSGLLGYWPFDEGGGGMSYSGIGPPLRLGQNEQADAADPLWVISTVPFEEE